MRKSFVILVVFMGLMATGVHAQYGSGGATALYGSGYVAGGLGMAFIDDETYLAINFRPDVAIGKFGIGLNINLLYNTETGHIRTEDWNEDYDYARLIRYIRYGRKRDKVYARVGTLDAARLGHGFIMNYYTNEASWDARKIGLAFDLDLGLWGFETVTSNLGRLEIIGGRGYIRPLRAVTHAPIIKNLTFGATYVTDVDPDGNRDTEEDKVSVWGVDVELPLIDIPMFYTGLYADHARINEYGSGEAFGIEATLRAIGGVAEVTARLERRLLGDRFLPSYFGAFYEIERERYKIISDTTVYRKDEALELITEETQGIFGELSGHVLNTIQLIGTFQRLDNRPHSGILHLVATVPDAVPKIAAHATYDKKGIEKFSELFTLDDRSVARVGLGYKIKPFLHFYVDYIYTFKYNDEKEKYEPQERIEPRLALVYNFGF